jgi:hypothetical protein
VTSGTHIDGVSVTLNRKCGGDGGAFVRSLWCMSRALYRCSLGVCQYQRHDTLSTSHRFGVTVGRVPPTHRTLCHLIKRFSSYSP